MKNFTLFLLIVCTSTALSGCIAAAAGAGIAGGAYIEKHYDVDFNVKKKQTTPSTQSKKETSATDSDLQNSSNSQ